MPLTALTTAEHRALVHQLRDDAEQWLAAKGLDQYQPTTPGSRSGVAHQDIDAAFDRGEFLALQLGDELVAVATLGPPDAAFWTAAELAEPQAYVGRLMVAAHGRGYGAALLAAITTREIRAGSRWLRLDCWRTNRRLHAYYRARGFTHVRTTAAPGRMSGALFQLDLQASLAQQVDLNHEIGPRI